MKCIFYYNFWKEGEKQQQRKEQKDSEQESN